jgi:tRNA(fMet)-specific endonuclease VapC
MANQRYILDTNIISALLKKNSAIATQMDSAVRSNAEFLLCPVVYFEIRRGLLHLSAPRQLRLFDELVSSFLHSEFELSDWREAAEIWADLRKKGIVVSDADILIGTFAKRRSAIVVTGNQRHFHALPSVQWINWLTPTHGKN